MPVDDGLASEQWIRFQYCVDLDALVLTKKLGYIPLRDVTTNDLVWDGFEYAQHEGLVYRGWKECVRVDGVWMTPEHKVLVAGKWVEAGELVPESPREARDVADLLNCGSRFRFTVCGESAPLIVSNCRDRGHLEFINKADKCDKYFCGEQWLQSDLNALALQRRPAITINKIISTLGTLFGEQIYNRTEVLFRPQNGSPSEVADALSKVWMQISQNNQLPWLRSDVFCDGIIRSRGFYDVRLDFTDSMLGEVRITSPNSKNVLIDPDGEQYDPDTWMDCFTTKWLSWQDVAVL